PTINSRAPTTSRRIPIGIAVSASPKTATSAASTTRPPAAPAIEARQPLVTPTPATMATISMASTAEARNVVTATASAALLMRQYRYPTPPASRGESWLLPPSPGFAGYSPDLAGRVGPYPPPPASPGTPPASPGTPPTWRGRVGPRRRLGRHPV